MTFPLVQALCLFGTSAVQMNLTAVGTYTCLSPSLAVGSWPAGGYFTAVSLKIAPNGADAVDTGIQFSYYQEVVSGCEHLQHLRTASLVAFFFCVFSGSASHDLFSSSRPKPMDQNKKQMNLCHSLVHAHTAAQTFVNIYSRCAYIQPGEP